MTKEQYVRNTECHCILCDPEFSTRGVTHFIDVHHIGPDGGVWYLGDSVEGSGKDWKLKA